jgi:pimeloyl-ACP methyl ester carboxylesterase
MTSLIPTSRSEFLRARGLRHHVRRWGSADAAPLFLGHGYLDVSASFEPLATELVRLGAGRWQVLAPDWRGFGYSEWPQDGYWFQDYVADLDAIVEHYSPGAPLTLIGHSMGAQIVSLHAGLRPARVEKLVLLDGLAWPGMSSAMAPQRFRSWLDEVRETPKLRRYPSFDDLAGRIRRQHPQLDDAHALFIARCWGREDGSGGIVLCADPKHHRSGPGVYHVADSESIWREITADTLHILAGRSQFRATPALAASRDACFRSLVEATIEDSGHMLHFDAPEETARRIAAFLDR